MNMRNEMRRLVVIGAALTCLLSYHPSEVRADDATTCMSGVNFVPVPYAFEQILVSTTALPLTRTVYAPTGASPANPAFMAILSTEADVSRYTVNGTTPTTTVGHLVAVGTYITLCSASIPSIRLIRSGAADVTVTVTYYRPPQG